MFFVVGDAHDPEGQKGNNSVVLIEKPEAVVMT
jgi:hypothetical protein